MNLDELAVNEEKFFLKTYKRLNIAVERGEGCFLITKDKRKILDMFSGLAVNLLGYSNPAVTRAAFGQIHKYTHLSNLFLQDAQSEFAIKLLEKTGYSKLFLCNSGTEANETALKMVRKFFFQSGKKNIISFSGSFHGRTYGSLSLTNRKKYRENFEPFLSDVTVCSYNSVAELISTADDRTAAVFIEFIQGEGGIIPANAEFIDKLFSLREKAGFLIIADEIQSGIGRTGKFFAFEHAGVKPDAVTLAKGIGGGFPLGVLMVNEKLSNSFETGNHGSTFGGNPVACAAGGAVLDYANEELMSHVKQISHFLFESLTGLQIKYPGLIKELRGIGLMIGIEMSADCNNTVSALLNQNVLVNCTNNNVIRLLPPLIIRKEECEIFLSAFEKYLNNLQ